MKKIRMTTYPKWVVIQLTEKCNLRCHMCYEWGKGGAYHHKERPSSLDFSVISQVIQNCIPGKPHFGLFGGEPFLYPKIGDVISLIKKGGCNVDIPTNGIFIEEHAELLVETKPNRLWISLDGPENINDKQRGYGVFKKVIKGINTLYEIRKREKSDLPKIGITFIVTPLNHTYVEEFFLNCIDLSKIDHLSIEFQTFATEKQYKMYAQTLKNEFGILSAPYAQGICQDSTLFENMNFHAIVKQIKRVQDMSRKHNIYFIAYPKTIELNNIRNYFLGNRNRMSDKRSRCAFPWIYVEISALGDVTPCHTFYDLSLGNVYENNILEIWNGKQLKKVRKYLRQKLFAICTACPRYYADPDKH